VCTNPSAMVISRAVAVAGYPDRSGPTRAKQDPTPARGPANHSAGIISSGRYQRLRRPYLPLRPSALTRMKQRGVRATLPAAWNQAPTGGFAPNARVRQLALCGVLSLCGSRSSRTGRRHCVGGVARHEADGVATHGTSCGEIAPLANLARDGSSRSGSSIAASVDLPECSALLGS
jgi:hypothetical protein